MDNEYWVPVKGFENSYEISSMGRVRKKPKIMKQSPNGHGYKKLTLSSNGKTRCTSVHILMAESFLGERPKDLIVNHKNGIKADNNIENLEYTDQEYNMQHAVKHNLVRLKLSKSDILFIRSLHRKYTRIKLAEMFNSSVASIGRVIRKESYKLI